ncbi:bifunctional phosphoribosylaminoimidazolecarboxamide formyltransferase/IMP cyclohydrolase [bacterium]|nr:bifunctional phosphoribosylaminoimidazolecarboxamide formyltransferase/IMP cyclohydrolase [bacterium]
MPKIERAIVSVTDKTGVVDFCKVLAKHNVEILSTGGTAKVLREAGLKVIDVSDYTGSPEVMDGRLKTIHPMIEGGMLGIRSNPSHVADMKRLGIKNIDMVIVNLYAFEKTVADPKCSLDHAIENIDIGGPTMLRAAAKNHQDVTVVVDSGDYICLAEELDKNNGVISTDTNFKLAVKVFQTTAAYDSAIAAYLTPKIGGDVFPDKLTLQFEKLQDLRYGENPHQKACAYRDVQASKGALTKARQLQGKELSFNNFIDLEAALACVREFTKPACVIIKHTNPCGAAVGKNISDAFIRAKASDPVSAFGGIIGLNREVDEDTAKAIGETFFECIIAPSFSNAAMQILGAKKNLRLMTLDGFNEKPAGLDIKRIDGGILVQDKDTHITDIGSCKVVTKKEPTQTDKDELDFAWKVVKHIKSNAILFTKNEQIIGMGAGQTSRVDSVKIAIMKAKANGHEANLKGAVVASDAFFPFRDGLDETARAGITAAIQPGGSVKDEEVINAANEHGMVMLFTGNRHFKH